PAARVAGPAAAGSAGPLPPEGGGASGVLAGQAPTQSPTFAGPPVSVPWAEDSSAEVTLSLATAVVTRRSTRPVAGSLISRPGRITSYSAPIFTPALVPTLMMMSPPETSAINAGISTLASLICGAPATTWLVRLSTAARVASPMMVPPKSELLMSNRPAAPTPPTHAPPRPDLPD